VALLGRGGNGGRVWAAGFIASADFTRRVDTLRNTVTAYDVEDE